ncbi:hypothetical protein DICVIV_02571 [Dictyocaulus viviparus]|uniref:Receptor ligand binding region domain-containing protein n=1 Tax=Dictyocaulus viviparus TaxID=29172 RepID=A0A0D8Y9H3_DICVI|nr:hypothetical protein DICVIV_02571 [Dictyocaulus viviparus]
MAVSEFLENLRWTSFLLIYQHDSDLVDLAPLIYDRRSSHYGGSQAAIKLRKLPNNNDNYEAFLRYVKNHLQQTNIVIHTNNISTLYTLLQEAKNLNMTEPPYSYIFTNTDLPLLEGFLSNVYGVFYSNITGLQLVKSNPIMKTTLALTLEAIWVAGMALRDLKEIKDDFQPVAILCDAKDSWIDGPIMNNAIRQLHGRNQLTGDIQFDERGERENIIYYGIGRINSQFVQEQTGFYYIQMIF